MIATLAAVTAPGGYFSLAKIIGMLVLVTPWFYAAAWAGRDVTRVRGVQQTAWSVIITCCAALGFVLWLAVGIYGLGLVLFIVLAAGGLIAYVVARNAQVPPERRVLTGRHLGSLFGGKAAEKKGPLVEDKVKIYGANGRVVLPPEPPAATPERIQAYNLAQELLYQIVWRRASDADLSATSDGSARLTLVIDGVAGRHGVWGARDTETVIQFIKEHAGLDLEERRRPQKGRITAELDGQRADMVVTSAGTTSGQRIQFRIEQETVKTNLEELGMAEDQLARVRQLLGEPGLLIVSGPPKSGVTSTLYALLRDYDAFTNLLATVENAPAVELENVTQMTYDEDADRSRQLASLLRRDPDVVGVDRCRDAETAELIAEAAESKHLLLAMQASTALSALAKWVKLSEDTASLMRNLRAVLCQVLLRRLCPSCKEAYRPKPELLAKANLKNENVEMFYRPPSEPQRDEKGRPIPCATCQGSGYYGRTAAFELLEVTDDVRELVLSGASLSQIKAECRKARMLYLQERALQKVLAGETSVQEVIRVTQDRKKK
ncbi:MAG: GspE/PulE family protein [Planctomycetota bacterium]